MPGGPETFARAGSGRAYLQMSRHFVVSPFETISSYPLMKHSTKHSQMLSLKHKSNVGFSQNKAAETQRQLNPLDQAAAVNPMMQRGVSTFFSFCSRARVTAGKKHLSNEYAVSWTNRFIVTRSFVEENNGNSTKE